MGWYEPTDDQRCTAILDAETGRRCPQQCYTGSDLCWWHYEGPEKTAARKKGGAAFKRLCERVDAAAAMLPQATTRAGMQRVAVARVVEFLDERDPVLVASCDRNIKTAAQLAGEIEDGGDNTQTIEVGVTINVKDRGDLAERVAHVRLVDKGDDG